MSLKYIAGKAGVSITTVSNVLNRKGHVSLKVAQRVRGIVQAEGIAVKHRKRKRRSTASRHIALAAIGETFLSGGGVFHSKLLKGMRSVLKTRDYSLLLPSGTMPDDARNEIRGAEALVLVGSSGNPELLADAVAVPVIWLFHPARAGYDAVVDDDREASRLAAEYLFGKGHRVVGYVGGFSAEATVEKGVFFCHFMECLGGTVVTAMGRGLLTAHGGDADLDMDCLRGMVGMLLAGAERITALFLPCNHLFVPVSSILKGMGVHPGDNFEILSCITAAPEIWCMSGCSAVIDINLEDIGKRAAECVFWRLDNPGEVPIRISVCPRLVVVDDEGQPKPMK